MRFDVGKKENVSQSWSFCCGLRERKEKKKKNNQKTKTYPPQTLRPMPVREVVAGKVVPEKGVRTFRLVVEGKCMFWP